MSSRTPSSTGGLWRGFARTSLVVAIVAVMVISSLVVMTSTRSQSTPSPSSYVGPDQTGTPITFTGHPATDFPSNALLYTNLFTPWGSANNLTGLYGTWNATELYLAVSTIELSGNNLLLAISNHSAWGTTNLTNLAGVTGVSSYDRNITFTEPVNFLLVVNSSWGFSAYEVTSQPGAATTTVVTLTLAASSTPSTSGGSLEAALSFSTLFPGGFPKFATVSLFAGIFGGGGPWIGPTIPSGDGYDWGYGGITDTSHDLPHQYLLVNSFYTLHLDPNGLGAPESGIIPNYYENYTFHTVTFTGSLGTDFAPGEKALLNTNTGWSATNELNSAYITWNETTLFLGFNTTVQGTGNSLGIFLGNDTKSVLGTYTLHALNDPSLNRSIVFSQPINFITRVNYSGSSVPLSLTFDEVTTPAATSNTTVMVQNVTSQLSSVYLGLNAIEMAIPLSLFFGEPSTAFPLIGEYANLSMIAAVFGGGNATGPTLPAGQTSTNGYNPYHAVGPDTILNTFFTENLDPYGDAVSAAQINPTYTYGTTYHTVTFTGIVTSDFVPPEIVGTSNFTGWSASNLLNATYATWNFTTLFIGTNSTVGGGNTLLVAISNDTGQGATNFSKSNVPDLTRNITFTTPINFAFIWPSGAPNGSLYAVNLVGTTSTQTNFTFVANFTAGKDGEEFAIPWTVMYPAGSSPPYGWGAGEFKPGLTPQLVAMIYGGNRGNGYPGDYIGPTIPMGQSSGGTPQTAVIGLFETLRVDPNKDGFAEPGIVPSAVPVLYRGNPISLNIVFNDHQPLYAPVGGSYLLPWTVVHLEEYLEQALIAGENPTVNITYSLSGSLLYQIIAIAHGDYNNSYLEAASIPTSQWGNTVYTEVTTYGDTFLGTFVQPYQYNTTTVASVLENDLAFNSPPWVYYVDNNASKLYLSLYHMWTSGQTFSTAQLEEALVEFFLWSTSYPVETGQLGSAYINSTMWSLYNDTSFTIGDIYTIQAYYPYEAQMVLSAFSHDRMLNDGMGGNVELITTPFDHPILPLLLLNDWTDENGASVVKGVWANDTIAQLQIGAELYNQTFGQNPLGLWSPEQAVSAAEIPYVNETGYEWTASSQATVYEAGNVSSESSPVTAAQMESLYTPYLVKNGSSSTVMVFRDDGLSNDWGFNYGGLSNHSGSEAAVTQFIDYLKNIYATVPRADHDNILVTVALDGENWMFMGSTGNTFPEDGVPFLQDLYASLASNSSWLSSTTPQQYLVAHPASTLPTITSLPTGSWNDQPTVTGVNSYLGQWAGNPLQDSTWIQLTLVRSMVQAFGAANGLTQPTTLAQLEAANNFPYLTQWNSTSLQDKYTEAWTAIYGVEGSDIYYSFSPDQSATAQNAIVFEQEVRSDLSLALNLLGLPLTPFLKSPYIIPESPTTWGTNASISPVLSGSLYTTETFPGGLGYSVNHNIAWAGSYVKATGNTTAGSATIVQTNYAFDVSNLYFSVEVNGPTSAYKAPTFYTPATDALDVFFSGVNPGQGNLLALNVPDSIYTVGNVPFGFAATTKATIEGNSITPTGSATMALYTSSASGWVASSTLPIPGDAWVGHLLQVQVPMSDIGSGMQPGSSIEFSVAVVNGTTGAVQCYSGPMLISVPASLAKLTVISTIHNTAVGNGPGTSTYPTEWYAGRPDFPADTMTIRWLQVAMNPYTVQFNVTFGNLSNPFGGAYGFSQPMIDIYIHVAGATGGSTAGLTGSEINISSADAWQYAIQASGYSSGTLNELVTSTGQSYPADVQITSNTGETAGANWTIVPNATVSIRVPTSIIGTAMTTDTFVFVAGGQNGYGTGDWRWFDNLPPTSANNVTLGYAGGITTAPLSAALFAHYPNVYSYIAPAIVGQGSGTQQSLLSTYSATSLATLEGITLPVTTKVPTHVAVLGASTIVNASGDPTAYYAVGSQVYSSTSTDGVNWTTPAPLVNLSFVPNGLSAVGGSTPALFAWNGSSYVFDNIGSAKFTNGTVSAGAIEAAEASYVNGAFLLVYDVGGTVYVGAPGAAPLGSDDLSATTVGLSTANGAVYLAYTTATALYVIPLTVTSTSVSFGSSTALTATLPASSTVESIDLAGAPNGGVAVALDIKNASGSNIYLAVGTGTVTLKTLTTDGQDSFPSVLLEENSAGAWEAYVGFTNSASGGNVFFLPSAVGTVSPVTVTKAPSPSPSVAWWVWVVIAVVVILVIVVAIVALMRRGKKGGPAEPMTPSTPSAEAEQPMSTPETPPPTGGGSTP